MEEQKKDNRGGARKGAGRPPKGVQKTTLYLTPKAMNRLSLEKNMSQFVSDWLESLN